MNLEKISKKSSYLDIIEYWLDTKKGLIKEQSYQKYDYLIQKHIRLSKLGAIPLAKLKLEYIMDFIDQKEKWTSKNKPGGLSASTIKTLTFILKASVLLAVSKKYCKPMNLTEIVCHKKEKREIIVLSRLEQIKMEQYLKRKMNIRKVGVLLSLYTGLRIGELCALQWKDIDLINKQLKVNNTVQRIRSNEKDQKTTLICGTPKSQSSHRTIPIPDFIIPLLEACQLDANIFMLSRKAYPTDPRDYQYFFARLLRNCHIHHVKFHTLRHTFATRCIEAGMDIKTLSEILGHANVNITLSIYVHSSLERKKVALEKLVSYMENEKNA